MARLVVSLWLVLAVTFGAGPAHAQWLRAESERFIVYSDGREPALHQFVQQLEVFDRVLRLNMGLDTDEPPFRKLPIYLTSDRLGVRKVSPGMSENVVGFYSATDEDIFAIALNDATRSDARRTLFHEYAHHFMMQHFSAPYPPWFVEGFAEYFMTAEFRRDRVVLGGSSEGRAYWLLNEPWMPTADLLSARPLRPRVKYPQSFYPLSWLLTHWFLSEPARRPMLLAYLRDVGAGADSVEAMERATGMSLAQLRRALRGYQRLQLFAVDNNFPAVPVTVTRLPRSADDLLLLNQRLKLGVPADQRAATAEEVRRAASRHGEDPLALLALGHAELHFGDVDVGRRTLGRLLEIDPNHVEAMQLLAQDHLAQAAKAETPEAQAEAHRAARRLLAQAYAVDDANFSTMLLLSRLRTRAPDWPNENDVHTLEITFTLAPQLAEARFNLAEARIRTDRKDEAIALLAPLASNPHGGSASAAARTMINRARGVTDAQADAEEEAAAQGHANDDDE